MNIPNAWSVFADISSSNLGRCVFADSILVQHLIFAHITLLNHLPHKGENIVSAHKGIFVIPCNSI